MIMGEQNDEMRKRDKKKIDDDDSMQFSSTGQPGMNIIILKIWLRPPILQVKWVIGIYVTIYLMVCNNS